MVGMIIEDGCYVIADGAKITGNRGGGVILKNSFASFNRATIKDNEDFGVKASNSKLFLSDAVVDNNDHYSVNPEARSRIREEFETALNASNLSVSDKNACLKMIEAISQGGSKTKNRSAYVDLINLAGSSSSVASLAIQIFGGIF
ncbi:hypothetical protein [Qipengyuania sp. JC766]|uniref:hypothetical protein n=1 Tax=Qipengyuania sp. JC766 TaxID=3232139 RepID=UPI003459B4FD